jgi:hypothetical protein
MSRTERLPGFLYKGPLLCCKNTTQAERNNFSLRTEEKRRISKLRSLHAVVCDTLLLGRKLRSAKYLNGHSTVVYCILSLCVEISTKPAIS